MALHQENPEKQPLLSHSSRPCQGIVSSSTHILSKESTAVPLLDASSNTQHSRYFPLSLRAKILLTMVAIPTYLLASSAVSSLGPLTARSPEPAPVPQSSTLVTDPSSSGPFGSVLGPLVESNFPDPAVIYLDGVSYAFATNNRGVGDDMIHIQMATSTDNQTWTIMDHHDALPQVGAWETGARVWAPDVIQLVSQPMKPPLCYQTNIM